MLFRSKARAGRLRCLPACPFMHGTAHWIAFTTLYSGGTVVISPDRAFDPARLWRLIAAEQVNLLVIVGDAFARPLVESLDRDVPADEVEAHFRTMPQGYYLHASPDDAAHHLRMIHRLIASVSEADAKKILGGNAIELFDLI